MLPRVVLPALLLLAQACVEPESEELIAAIETAIDA